MSVVTGFIVYDVLLWSFLGLLTAIAYLVVRKEPASSVASSGFSKTNRT